MLFGYEQGETAMPLKICIQTMAKSFIRRLRRHHRWPGLYRVFQSPFAGHARVCHLCIRSGMLRWCHHHPFRRRETGSSMDDACVHCHHGCRYNLPNRITHHDSNGRSMLKTLFVTKSYSPTISGLGEVHSWHRQRWQHGCSSSLARGDVAPESKGHRRRQGDERECSRFCNIELHHPWMQWHHD
jgi:hypothetical protein